MKIILTQEVSGVGSAGDVVEVKDGYARNYLVPRGLGMRWTKGAERQIDSLRKRREVREIRDLETAEEVAARIEGTPVVLTARAGDGGRLFGAVTPADITAALASAGGPAIDKRKVEVSAPIKAVGVHTVSVRLHPELSATITLDVQPA